MLDILSYNWVRFKVVEVVAGAAYPHNLYNAVENCLLRVARAVDESVPDGPDWHRILFDQTWGCPRLAMAPRGVSVPL